MPAYPMNVIVILCSDCREAPIVLTPRFGDARAWDGIVICKTCGDRRSGCLDLMVNRLEHV
jgi:hypothetical protein